MRNRRAKKRRSARGKSSRYSCGDVVMGNQVLHIDTQTLVAALSQDLCHFPKRLDGSR